MLFNSFEFLLFFPIVAVAVYKIRHPAFRLPFLLAASYFFYMWWRPAYILLLLASTGVDYFAGLLIPRMESPARKRLILLISIITNLGLLGVFKYFNFGVASMNGILGWAGSTPLSLQANWVLPVGISFYTFQSLSYTIDVYRGDMQPRRGLVNFTTALVFFPQLVAGPIVRAIDFLPQLRTSRVFASIDFRACFTLFLIGFIKKACVSDNLAPIVDKYFAAPELYGVAAAWIATLWDERSYFARVSAGSRNRRMKWVGTHWLWVTQCRSISAKACSASNFFVITEVPPKRLMRKLYIRGAAW